jgi:hypothetical protein
VTLVVSNTSSLVTLTASKIFVGPVASITVAANQIVHISSHTGISNNTTASQQIAYNICTQLGVGALTTIGGPDSYAFTPVVTGSYGSFSIGADYRFTAAGTYSVGACASNIGAGSIAGGNGSTSVILYP